MSDKPTQTPEEVPPGTRGSGENTWRRCKGSGKIDDRTCPDGKGAGKLTTPIGGA